MSSKLKTSFIIMSAAVLYLVPAAVMPYMKQPEVSEETEASFDISDFYGDGQSEERAMIISENGEALSERIRLIANAKERIILSTFEFDSDESGKDILAALIDAADRGVKVYVVVDGIPGFTQMYGNPYFLALSSLPNAEIKIYNPVNVLKPWKVMGRMHDKYLIADNTAYILGGRNTYDFFLGDNVGYKNYDWDVLVYNGSGKEEESLGELSGYFNRVWSSADSKFFGDKDYLKKLPSVGKASEELKTRYSMMKEKNPEWFSECDYREITKPVNSIKLLSNPTDTKVKEPLVFYNMIQLMKQAENRVVFHTPYIICNEWMLNELEAVCGNVKNVTMMTNSVANNGNPFGAMDYEINKDKILDTGVQIVEYDGGVSYHGKCFAIDDRLSAVGSFNWDMRSAYLDTELMLIIDSEEINHDLTDRMNVYSEQALIVVDEETSIAPEGVIPQEISSKNELRKKLVRLIDWARFLM